ncbi:MAG: amidohydrolase family protein [Candidatus Sphingomonas colombiensis]|nr:amidohydrolase family protein [Sphingomonas sp.]WEK43976.1 MAG: amidohydrolase family protein [Sphingomonas sp.]
MRAWLLAMALLGSSSLAAPVREARIISYVTEEGTDFSINPSPADGSLLIDLQGSLWSISATGGEARRLTTDLFEAMHPSWSPDGRQIAVESYADGMWHIWILSADGKQRRQLTSGAFDDTFPRWSPDGKTIAFLSARDGKAGIWLADPGSVDLRRVPASGLAMPQALNWTAGGALLLADMGRLKRVSLDGRVEALDAMCEQGTATAPALSPSGKRLAYVCAGADYGRLMLRDETGKSRVIGAATDVFPLAPAWRSEDRLLYSGTGKIHSLNVLSGMDAVVPFRAKFRLQRAGYQRKRYDFDDAAAHAVKGIVAPSLSPDGKRIVFKALNDLWLVDLNGNARRLTDDAFYENDPVWAPDGRSIAYVTDASGIAQLWTMDVASGGKRRIGRSAHANVAPAWSPDGKQIAYQTETGETRTIDVASGADRALVPALDFPSRPTWSANGRTIAFTAANDSRNRILLVDVASGRQRWIDATPNRSISTRGDDGPIWSPDGKWLAFSMMSRIWVLPVAPDGTPTGTAKPLTSEASDAPSWAGDSRTILYLANGTLKLVDRETGRTRVVPLKLDWRQERAKGRILVHAGRLWDGVHPEVRENVDILIEGNRIARIVPHGPHENAGRVIDASNLTVTPGLFEMHNHQQLRSKYLGDRQGRMWLAYGITSTRSTGDPVYRALEDREALASGARIGPRHFMTGEMLEGSRPMWSFSRPIEDQAQLDLELSRAEALGYDVIKTYMRFRSDWQAQVAERAHRRMGVSVTSHFAYPGIAHGVDGEEHFVGPTRWTNGFPHLFRGGVYDDIFQALEKSGIEITTTNFAGRQELLELPGLPGDPRIAALYPAWEQASLKEFMGCAAKTGPCNFFLTPNEEQSRLTAQDLIRVIRGGGRVMIGSDAPLDSFTISTFQNLYTLQKFGLSPFEALRTATTVPAQAQGVEADLGSVEVGKLADLVFVEGRPDADVRDLMKVRSVMKAGRYFTVDELIAPYGAAAQRRE